MTVGRSIYLYIIVPKEVVVDRRFSMLPSSGSLYIEYNIIILYGVRCVRSAVHRGFQKNVSHLLNTEITIPERIYMSGLVIIQFSVLLPFI